MTFLRVTALATVVLILATAAYFMLNPSYFYHQSGSLVPVFIRDHHGNPEEWVAAIITSEGRLPKTGVVLTHLGDDRIAPMAHTHLFPVASWEMEGVLIQTPDDLFTMLRRQDLVYSLGVDFRVRYGDGDTAFFRWHTWRYGMAFGPVVLDEGGGPAGDLVRLD